MTPDDLTHDELMPTGVAGLDHLLAGGLVRGNSLLVEGPPGSGKTTLAIRIVYEGIVQWDEPGLIITFEEFPRQIYREAMGYGVDLAALEEQGKLRVVWTPPQRILDGFAGRSDLIDSLIEQLGVRRLVIDSITHFKRVAHDEVQLRETLADLLNTIKLRGINSILVKELERMDDRTIAFEEYLVDASLRVYNTPAAPGAENLRTVEVRKTRGQPHISGRHPFRLGHDLRVFPTLRPADVSTGAERSRRDRQPVGLVALDRMLGGGLRHGSMALLQGGPGTGKTILAGHFAATALKGGERALLLSLRADGADFPSSVQLAGAPQDSLERLEVLHRLPLGITLEEILNDVWERFRENRPARLILDSVEDLLRLATETQVRDAIVVLGQMAAAAGATTLLLQGDRAGSLDCADLADAAIQLTLTESDGELHRFLGIRKGGVGDAANELRQFVIDELGFQIRRKPTGLSGILSGNARGVLTDVADHVMPALEEVSRSAADLEQAKLGEEELRRIREMRTKLATMDVLLREHFGLTDFAGLAESLGIEDIP